jgi:quinolinate synthase
MSSEQIGCSLADAASSSEYTHFLREASKSHPSLHVIYINTSLETKAHAHELVPTITCTSSNVVPTILQVNDFLIIFLSWPLFVLCSGLNLIVSRNWDLHFYFICAIVLVIRLPWPSVLQAFAQVPDINVWYGPDSYMGANIADLFQRMATMSDEEIAAIHPNHNRKSINSLLPRLHYYQVFVILPFLCFWHFIST